MKHLPAWTPGEMGGERKEGESIWVKHGQNVGQAQVIWMQESSEFILVFNHSSFKISLVNYTYF